MAGGLNPIGMLQGKTDSAGALIVSVDSGSTAVVISVAGTANQVLVNGGTAAVGGAVTLSLSPTLAGIDSITFSGGQSLVGTTANVTELYNAANAQTWTTYGTRTSATVYERIEQGYSSGDGTFYITTRKGGSGGTARPLALGADGSLFWRINTTGNLVDLGSHSITAGTSVISPLYVAGATNGVTAGPFTTITSIRVIGGIVTTLTGS